MDNLLCDEVWLSNNSENTFEEVGDFVVSLKSYEHKEFEEAFTLYLEKEASSLPEHNYAKYLHSNNLFLPRCRVIQWLVKVSIFPFGVFCEDVLCWCHELLHKKKRKK